MKVVSRKSVLRSLALYWVVFLDQFPKARALPMMDFVTCAWNSSPRKTAISSRYRPSFSSRSFSLELHWRHLSYRTSRCRRDFTAGQLLKGDFSLPLELKSLMDVLALDIFHSFTNPQSSSKE